MEKKLFPWHERSEIVKPCKVKNDAKTKNTTPDWDVKRQQLDTSRLCTLQTKHTNNRYAI